LNRSIFKAIEIYNDQKKYVERGEKDGSWRVVVTQ